MTRFSISMVWTGDEPPTHCHWDNEPLEQWSTSSPDIVIYRKGVWKCPKCGRNFVWEVQSLATANDDPTTSVEAARRHHAKHGDMDGKVCLLTRCALHYPHNSTPKANTSIGEAEFVRTRVEAKAKLVGSPDKEVRLSASIPSSEVNKK